MDHPDWLMKMLGGVAMDIRRKAIRLLLEGNDVQCFTTEQYADKYMEVIPPELRIEGQDSRLHPNIARMHLLGLPEIEEVQPGIWSKVVLPDGTSYCEPGV